MGLFSWLKPGQQKRDEAAPRPPSPATRAPRFDAVEIIPDPDGCCMAVRKLAGKRILASKVPLLPLKDCDRARCACAYRRYADRRSDTRRVADMGVTLFDDKLPAEDEKRARKTGRRKADRQGTR